jgi:uncharacterized protein with von Willebrand factor type A (vWA) domain
MSISDGTAGGSWSWRKRLILALIAVGIGLEGLRAYVFISSGRHAEKGLHAARMTLQAVEEYVTKHDGAWPRSWADLERTSNKVNEVYQLTDGREHVADFVWIDFNADPALIAKQTEDDFDAIGLVGLQHPSYHFAVPPFLEALRKARQRARSTEKPAVGGKR